MAIAARGQSAFGATNGTAQHQQQLLSTAMERVPQATRREARDAAASGLAATAATEPTPFVFSPLRRPDVPTQAAQVPAEDEEASLLASLAKAANLQAADATGSDEASQPPAEAEADAFFDGMHLTPLNDRPFQAIATIARQAHSSLVERLTPRS